jgi:prephenate dehydrogenase
MSAFRKTAVLGVGLIGGSLAAAGRRAGVLGRVVGVGRSRANLETAIARGLIDEASGDAAAAVRDADLVVLAAPVDTSIDLLAAVAPHVGPGCVVTDVGSVKAPVLAAAARSGLARRFVGAHPMAGSTSAGAGAADADLFVDRVVVVTPTADTEATARERITELWRAVGARVVELDADLHDQAVAIASHLPQMLASTLAALAAADPLHDTVEKLAARGFRDTTRIAMSDVAMWLGIASANRRNLVAAMDAFADLWSRVREAVASGDEDALTALMAEAGRFRRGLERGEA